MPSATVSEAKNYIAHGLRNMCAAHEEEVEALREELKEWKDRCRDLQECLDNRRIFIEKIENAFADEETTEGEEEINDYDTWYAAHINKMSQRCMDILTEKSRVREEGVNLSEILGVMKLAADTLAKPADMNVNVA